MAGEGSGARPRAATAGRAAWPASRLQAAGEFLREELASSPERQRATLRIVVSCAIATFLIATLQIPNGAWLIITIFVVSQPNAGATLKKGVQRLGGTMVACGAGMILIAAFADVPWLRVPIGGFAAGLSIFLFRTTTAPYSAILGGMTFVLFFLNPTTDVHHLVDFGLWRALLIFTGVAIVLLVDVLLLPTDPERQLLDDLARRLGMVEAVLDAAVGAAGRDAAAAGEDRERALRGLVLGGLPREIELLSDAEARHRRLRERHPEQIVLITAVDRLAMQTLALQRHLHEGGEGAGEAIGPLRPRLAAVRDGAAALRRSIVERRPPSRWSPPEEDGLAGEAPLEPGRASVLAAVIDMEGALRLAARALGFLGGAASPPRARREELSSVLDAPDAGYFTPAFSLANRADLQVAMKAGLAEVLVYLVMLGTSWPGIQTGLVTVLVISGASNGAMIHKAILRCAGAMLGGLVGLAAIVTVMPLPTSIVGFVPIAAACYAVAAWVTTGGPRISYAGVQTGIALSLVLAETLGPTVDLEPARDRVMGIVIADMLTTVVFYALWPVFATQGMRRGLAVTFHGLAALSRVGARLVQEDLVRPARGFRWQVLQSLNTTTSMHDEAAFEANAGTPEVTAARAAVHRLLPLSQDVLIGATAVVRHRMDVDLSRLPEGLADTVRAYSRALADALDAIGDRVEGKPERPVPELAPLLDAAESAIAEHRARAGGDPQTMALLVQAAARTELQRELLPLVLRLDRETRALAPRLAALG